MYRYGVQDAFLVDRKTWRGVARYCKLSNRDENNMRWWEWDLIHINREIRVVNERIRVVKGGLAQFGVDHSTHEKDFWRGIDRDMKNACFRLWMMWICRIGGGSRESGSSGRIWFICNLAWLGSWSCSCFSLRIDRPLAQCDAVMLISCLFFEIAPTAIMTPNNDFFQIQCRGDQRDIYQMNCNGVFRTKRLYREKTKPQSTGNSHLSDSDIKNAATVLEDNHRENISVSWMRDGLAAGFRANTHMNKRDVPERSQHWHNNMLFAVKLFLLLDCKRCEEVKDTDEGRLYIHPSLLISKTKHNAPECWFRVLASVEIVRNIFAKDSNVSLDTWAAGTSGVSVKFIKEGSAGTQRFGM